MTNAVFRFDPNLHVYTYGTRRLWSVTERLGAMGYIDTEWYTWQAKLRGKAAHLACQFVEQGGVDWNSITATEKALGVPVEPYVRGWERFLKETGWRSRRIEIAGYHPIYMYAGTPDRVGFWPDGQEGILDLKTGAAMDWWERQLGAYDEMEPRLVNKGARRLTAVRLTASGDYELVHNKDVNAGRMFLAINAVHQDGLDKGIYKDERPSFENGVAATA